MAVPALSPSALEAYLTRIRYDTVGARPVRPTRATLVALHRAHASSVPYELLDWHVPAERTDLGGLREGPTRVGRPPEAVDALHARLVAALTSLFDDHKHLLGPEWEAKTLTVV